ncbi:MAG: transglutaminase domain-containing protein [Bacteroidales bacterium]|nr:transglutaminase domain-containing protein [Bacteroidales bacterium]
MTWLRNKYVLAAATLFLFCWKVTAGTQPSQELQQWQQKYPGNALVMVSKQLHVTIDLVNNVPQTTLDDYQEMIVLKDNSAFLADSKEYFNNHFDLKKLEAYSLVPENNQYKKVTVSKFTKSVEMDNTVFFDDQYVYAYTYPAVGRGTKLVTRSVATTDYAYIPVVFDFGGPMPGENMELTLSIPREVQIIFKLFGNDTSIVQYNKTVKGNRVIHTWKADNPKYYDIDEKTPGSRYFVPHLIVQIAGYRVNNQQKAVIGSLKDLYAFDYSHISGLPDDIHADVTRLGDSITAGCLSDREKVRSIFRWVQKHIKYVAIEDGENGYVPSEAVQVLKRRYGDCKGKSSLLVSLIRSQGMKASYAWVGSRERPYKFSEFPSIVNSDHMIAAWWDGEHPVLLDGTTFSHRMEDVPAFIQGKECVIEKGKDDFMVYSIPVTLPVSNLVVDSVFVRIQGDTLTGTGKLYLWGENRARMIGLFEGKDTSLYNKILQANLPKASNKHLVTSVTIPGIPADDAPFVIGYSFMLPDYLTRVQQNAYVSLSLDRFLEEMIINRDRKTPLESPMTVKYNTVCQLLIPEGYGLKKLPENTSYSHSLFGFSEVYSQSEGRVELQSNITINFQVIDGPVLNEFQDMLSLLNRSYLKSLPLAKTQI